MRNIGPPARQVGRSTPLQRGQISIVGHGPLVNPQVPAAHLADDIGATELSRTTCRRGTQGSPVWGLQGHWITGYPKARSTRSADLPGQVSEVRRQGSAKELVAAAAPVVRCRHPDIQSALPGA